MHGQLSCGRSMGCLQGTVHPDAFILCSGRDGSLDAGKCLLRQVGGTCIAGGDLGLRAAQEWGGSKCGSRWAMLRLPGQCCAVLCHAAQLAATCPFKSQIDEKQPLFLWQDACLQLAGDHADCH